MSKGELPMKEITIMIKPASSACNCVCTYCFYDDVSDCREVKSYGLIDKETSDRTIEEAFLYPNVDKVNFAFQGGEPLIAGYDYFKEFVASAKRLQGKKKVSFSLQTNGTLLNDQFCKLFKNEAFLIGISIDGHKENHDRNRFLRQTGSFDEVYKGLELLRKHKIPFNVLSVLTKSLAKEPAKLFDFYKEEEFTNIQIIECLPDFGQTVEESPLACTPKLYESFYSQLFKLWKKELKRGNYISINLFEDCIRLINNTMPLSCGRSTNCQVQIITEADGSIYPCDFYVLDEERVGNIQNNTLLDIVNPKTYDKFLSDKGKQYSPCTGCPYFNQICSGGCKRMRETFINNKQCSYATILDMFFEKKNTINHHLRNLNLI